MSTAIRKTDVTVFRAKRAAFDAHCAEMFDTGQKLLARIRPESKYYGQGVQDGLFPVVITSQGEYAVSGGPGGQYCLSDVDLFAVFEDEANPIQITFGK